MTASESTAALQPDARVPTELWSGVRHCSVSPGQLLQFYLSLCVFALLVSACCWLVGGKLVSAFTGLDLLALAVGLLAYARHAGDRERVLVEAGVLVVEWESAGRVERMAFNPRWTRIGLNGRGLVEFSEGRRSACVGRYLRGQQREQLARQLRRSLLTV